MKKPKVKVIERKLGQFKADGFYTPETALIEIHPNLPPLREMSVTIHEYNHHLHPEWSEEEVIKFSNKMAKFLWKQKYRKVKQ